MPVMCDDGDFFREAYAVLQKIDPFATIPDRMTLDYQIAGG